MTMTLTIVVSLLAAMFLIRRCLRRPRNCKTAAVVSVPVSRMPPRPVLGLSRTQMQTRGEAPPVLTACWQRDGRVGFRAKWGDKEIVSLNGGVSFHVVQRNNMRILGDARGMLHLLPPIRGLRDIMAYAANQQPLSLRTHSKAQMEEILAEDGIFFEAEDGVRHNPPA